MVAGALDQQVRPLVVQVRGHAGAGRQRGERASGLVHRALGHDHYVEGDVGIALEQLKHAPANRTAPNHGHMQHFSALLRR
ncbi:hypothetical protein D3C81_1796300 [compost metagenome]